MRTGKEDLLDYLGHRSEFPSWVTTSGSDVEESFAPALTVCNRNANRGNLFNLLEKIGSVYYNEIWQRGSLWLFVGMSVILQGLSPTLPIQSIY